MRRLLILGLIAVAGCAPVRGRDLDAPRATTAASSNEEARVLRVVDGDTIVLGGIPYGEVDRSTGGRKARLIGIDTPETHGRVECYGERASAFTTRELGGKDVRVEFDVDTVDRYGRALVYVWESDGSFFNAKLAREGFALQLTIPPNVRYAALFSRLVTEARVENRGLWRAC